MRQSSVKYLMLGILLILNPHLMSVETDIDIESAQANYNQEKAEADAAKVEFQNAQNEIQPYHDQLKTAKLQLSAAANQLNVAKSNLSGIVSQIASKNSQLSNENSRLEQLILEASNIRGDISRSELNLNSLERERQDKAREIHNMEVRVRQLRQSADWECTWVDTGHEEHWGGHRSTNANKQTANDAARDACFAAHSNSCNFVSCERDSQQIRDLEQRIADANSELQRIDSRISDTNQQIVNHQIRLDQNQSQQEITRNRILNLQAEISSLNDSRFDAQHRVDEAASQVAIAQAEVNQAQSEVNARMPAFNFAKAEFEREVAESLAAKKYLDQVVANYNEEKKNAIQLGKSSGERDGGREGSERGTDAGAQLGGVDGNLKGKEKGQKDAVERSLAKGYAVGKQSGSTDPSLSTHFARGLSIGEKLAETNAINEKYPEGFMKAKAEVLASTPANSVTVDISDSIAQDPGSNGVDLRDARKDIIPSAAPQFKAPIEPQAMPPKPGAVQIKVPAKDGRYEDQPCDGLRKTEFIEACKSEYSQGYLRGLSQDFKSKFQIQYDLQFTQNAAPAYQSAFQNDAPASFEQGKNVAAEHLGIEAGYAKVYQDLATAQLARGDLEFRNSLNEGHLLVLRSVSVIESSGDGILQPSELAKLSITIDNLGKLSSPLDLIRVKISSKQNADSLNFEIRKLPSLAGQTRTTLQGVVSVKSTGISAGDLVQLDGEIEVIEDGVSKPISAFTAKAETHFPIEITAVKSPALSLSQYSVASITFKNMTNRTLEGQKIFLARKPKNLLAQNPDGIGFPVLEAGKEKVFNVSIKPDYTVDSSNPAEILSELLSADGKVVSAQLLKPDLSVNREASVTLVNMDGSPINQSIRVKAGTTKQFKIGLSCPIVINQSRFNFGIYSFSEPGVGTAPGTGIRFLDRDCPAKPSYQELAVFIPLSVKGKKVKIETGIQTRGAFIHTKMLEVIAE
ncbi:MAG: hypothetical protein NT027_10780 [Proteobacteria bacterium]|nr:hypothetical protein [Pseudomonadota bacterium]